MGNAVRTTVMMSLLIGLLAVGGWAFAGRDGLLLFGSLGLLLNFGAFWFSDRIALLANRARPLTREEAPGLYPILQDVADRAGLPRPPLYLIPSQSPNAFATGRGPRHAAVAVTEGLLQLLDERELEAVLAHELSHVRNRDVLVGTIAAAVAGIIASIGHVLQWGLLFGGSTGQGHRRGSGLQSLAWVIVAPVIALLLQLGISRTREYSADTSGARLLGDPDALADALEKLEAGSRRMPYEYAGPATAHLFIINPLQGAGAALSNLLSTHPPIEKRIAHLRAMGAH